MRDFSSPDALMHESFTHRVALGSDSTALMTESSQLSYSELDIQAERLATVLRELGVGPDVPVGVCLPRGQNFIIAILGVLKADGAYVPLDPSSPVRWIKSQLEVAAAGMVITQQADVDRLPHEIHVVLMDDVNLTSGPASAAPVRPRARPDNLAYIMYTSGSTGQPKAVAVPHRAVVRLVTGQEYAKMGPGQVFLFHSPPTFDASTFEIWGALLNGGELAIAPPGIVSVGEIGRLVLRYRVTTAWITAALFSLILEEDPAALRPLRQLLTGGEAVHPASLESARHLLPDTRLVVGYGPTESTVFATTYPIADVGSVEGVPIGRPIKGTVARILDENMSTVPPGVEGELYLAGDGLSWGYLGSPDLTAERFIPDPLSALPGSRIYRTGDKARWRADGIIEFRGRLDDELKIRGHRVEPMAIEEVLLRHPDVISAYVTAERNATRGAYLAAYLASRPGAKVEPYVLRSHMAGLVPDHMRPDVYVVRPTLPLTAHGKLDRRRLLDAIPVQSPRETRDHERYRVVRNHSEQCGLWPLRLQIPPGWAPIGMEGSRSDCMAYVRRTWTDIRPSHLQGPVNRR